MILVIDDEQLIIDLVGQIIDLESRTYDLVMVPDMAIKNIKSKKYSIIILDLHLGMCSGIDILKEIKYSDDSKNKQTPVYIMSGLIKEHEQKEIEGLIEGIIPKPFEIDDIAKIVTNDQGE